MDLHEQLERERQKFRSIQHIATAVGSTLELDQLLHLIVGKITELMDAERSSLYVLDEQREQLWTKVLQANELREIRLKVGEGVAGWVAQTGRAANIEDAYADERFLADVDQRTGYRTKSILCLPMRDQHGKITGVVQVLNKRGGSFSSEDEELLEALVSQASIAIENSKLYLSVVRNNQQLLRAQRTLQQRMTELDLLLEVQQQISQATSVDEVLHRVLTRIGERMGAEATSILLRDQDSDRLYFGGVTGKHRDVVQRLSVALGEGVAGWVAAHGQPAIVNDPEHDDRHGRELAQRIDFHPRNLICVPLRGQEGSLGAIELLNKIGAMSFDTDDERLLTLLAGRISQAIELARVKEQRIQESRMASIGQSLSGVLHDLRTPMTIISGYAQLMCESENRVERKDYVDQILRQFELMSDMTREVLAFARGESQLLVRKVYLHKFIPEMEEYLRHDFAGRKIGLTIKLKYRGIAHFDESKLRRVFQNIGRNAAQAMPDGGEFTIEVDNEDGQLVLSFADTGEGIPAELEGRLFEVFATAGKKDGTGLGLAIVKKIVDDHHGKIRYESERGRGTRFIITLPLQRAAVASSKSAQASA